MADARQLAMESSDRYHFPSAPKANPKATVQGDHYRFTVLTERLLRYEWSSDGAFEDRASTLAVFRRFEVPEFRVIDDGPNHLEIVNKYFRLTYDKKDFAPGGLTVSVGTETWRYDGASFGDLGGTARTLDGAAGRIDLAPGVLSTRSYAVLDDSESVLFGDDGLLAPRVPGRKDGYLFAYDGDHKAAMRAFYLLSGPQPLLPRWALGNWWSRYHAYTAEEYLSLMDRFLAEGIPLTVGVLDMDWHLVDIDAKYGSGWTGYTWNRDLFPDPEHFVKEVHMRGLRFALNDHPADGVRDYEQLYQKVAKALSFDTSHGDPIRFDVTDKKFLDAYFDVLKLDLEKQGIDFWWVDWQQGTASQMPGLDPLWPLNHFHYLTSRRNINVLEQPIAFSRYAGPGSHRYPIGFSGDTQITWDSLHFQPEFTATASNIGYGWWSHDIGGHYWGTRSNDLTARWVQLGCFSPVLRLHSEKRQWNSKEPWLYEREAYEVIKHFMVLRHRFVPFLFTMNVRASLEGEPLVQPMYWNHKDEEARNVPNQYYFGPDLVVAPITTPLSKTTLMGAVEAWLPSGRWIDLLHPGLVYDGGRRVHLNRTLDKIPVLAREGTILPLDQSPIKGNGTPRPTHMQVQLVVGADAFFELVEEDDSVEPRVRAGDASRYLVRTPIRWSQKTGRLAIGPETARQGESGPTAARTWSVRLVGHTNAATELGLRAGFSDPRVTRDAGGLVVNLGSTNAGRLDVMLGHGLQLDVVDVAARLHETLYRCESGYLQKETLWQLVTVDTAPTHVRLQRLYEMHDLDADLRGAVLEVWFADSRAGDRGRRTACDGPDAISRVGVAFGGLSLTPGTATSPGWESVEEDGEGGSVQPPPRA